MSTTVVDTLKVSFGKKIRMIDVKWKYGCACFGRKWVDFLSNLSIVPGDTITFQKLDIDVTLHISVFRAAIASKEQYLSGIFC